MGERIRTPAKFRNIPGLIVAAVLAMTAPALAEIRFAGEGDQITAPFTVDGPWEVRWTVKGRGFELIVDGIDRGINSWAANQIGPGSGVRHYVQPGTFFFRIRSYGAWEIEVLPMRPDAASNPKVP